MKPEIFLHKFESKKDILSEFGVDESLLDECHIYIAYYHVGDYGCDSSAYVLYECKGKLFEVHGCHCSCHGLSEDSYSGGATQWQPEEVNVDYLNYKMNNSSNDAILFFCGGYDDDVSKSKAACVEVITYLNNNH